MYQNKAKLAPKLDRKSDQKSMVTSKGDFSKILLPLQRGLDFRDSGAEVGSNNRSKIDQKTAPKMECILASIFEAILVDFWYQVGMENRPKIDQKRHRKNDWKKMGSMGAGSRYKIDHRGRDLLRPNAAQTRRAENPLPAAAKAAALRAKIPVKNNKETIVRVLTRPGPEARRIFIYIYI